MGCCKVCIVTIAPFLQVFTSPKEMRPCWFRIDLNSRVGYYCRRSGFLKMGLLAELLLVYSLLV